MSPSRRDRVVVAVAPTLWGPGLWHVLFVTAWNARDDQAAALRSLVFDVVPKVIPCPTCRNHFRQNFVRACREAGDRPGTGRAMFVWLYHMKRAVNVRLRTPSIALQNLTQRFEFHSGALDAVLLADTLLLLAMATADDDDAAAIVDDSSRGTSVSDFVHMCRLLSELLPTDHAEEATLRRDLALMQPPVDIHAYRICRNTRIEHGRTCPPMQHFRKLI